MNKIIDKFEVGSSTVFVLKTDDENHLWYWQVDTLDIVGTDEEFVNDINNAMLGCSCGNYQSVEEIRKEFE